MSFIVRSDLWIAWFMLVSAWLSLFSVSALAQSDGAAENPYAACWEFPVMEALAFPVLANKGYLYVPEANGTVRAIDVSDGRTLWTNELGGRIASDLVVHGNQLFVISSSEAKATDSDGSSTLWSIDPESGLTVQNLKLPHVELGYLISVESILIAIGLDGSITAFNMTGEVVWTRSLGSRLTTQPRFRRELLAVATESGGVTVIGTSTGGSLINRKSKNRIAALQITDDGAVVAGDERGNVTRFRYLDGAVDWKLKFGGAITHIAAVSDALAVTSMDNFLYFVTADNGKVKWRKRLAGRPVHEPLIVAEQILASAHGEDSIPISELRGGKTVNRIGLKLLSYPLQIPQVAEDGTVIVALPGLIVGYSNKNCKAN